MQKVFCISHNDSILLGMLIIKLITLFKLAGIKLVWFTERQVQLRSKEESNVALCGMVPGALTSVFSGGC